MILIPLSFYFKNVNDPYGIKDIFIILFIVLTISYLFFRVSIRNEKGFDYSVIYSFQDKMFKIISILFIIIGIVCFILSFLEVYFYFTIDNSYKYRSVFMLVLLITVGFIGIIIGRKFQTVIRNKFQKKTINYR